MEVMRSHLQANPALRQSILRRSTLAACTMIAGMVGLVGMPEFTGRSTTPWGHKAAGGRGKTYMPGPADCLQARRARRKAERQARHAAQRRLRHA